MDAYAQALQQSGYGPASASVPPPGRAMSQTEFNNYSPKDPAKVKESQANLQKMLEARAKAMKHASGGPVAGMDAYAQALQQSGYAPASAAVPPPSTSGTMSQTEFNHYSPKDPAKVKESQANLQKMLDARAKAMKHAQGGSIHDRVHHDVHHLIGHILIKLAERGRA